MRDHSKGSCSVVSHILPFGTEACPPAVILSVKVLEHWSSLSQPWSGWKTWANKERRKLTLIFGQNNLPMINKIDSLQFPPPADYSHLWPIFFECLVVLIALSSCQVIILSDFNPCSTVCLSFLLFGVSTSNLPLPLPSQNSDRARKLQSRSP